MWLLGLPRHGMLFRGLLYFMVHVNRQGLQFADKSCTFLPPRCPFPPGLRLSPANLPPKLPIKTNLASREIKPTLARGVAPTPSIPLCFLHVAFYYSPCVFRSLFASHSLRRSLKLPALLRLSLPPWPPPAPYCRRMCSCKKKGLPQYGYCVHWAFIWMSAWSPLANSIARLLVSSQKDHPFLQISIAFTESYLSTRLWVNYTVEPPSISRNTSSPSGIIWESINL